MSENHPMLLPRRDFITRTCLILGTASLGSAATAWAAAKKTESKTAEVTPTEDLMQEHGVLHRLLLIYDELGQRLKNGREFPLAALTDANGLMQRFIQDYHEKDEEEYLFARFRKSGKMVDLVDVLFQQYEAGRKLTARLQSLATPANLEKPGDRQKMAEVLQAFTRMYRPHAAREDTVLYPAFRELLPAKDFLALGDVFEEKEEKLLGKNGFEKIVAQVADLEQQLGVYDLTRFTPQV